jgi:hypothetical protein
MKSLKWILLKLIVAACGLYVVFTGGILFFRANDFNGQRDIALVEGLKSDVWLSPQWSTFSIPLVFHRYATQGPYDLRLQIWDETRQYRRIEVDEVIVAYGGGDVFVSKDRWSRELKPYTHLNGTSSGVIRTEMYMLSALIDGVVFKHADCTITLKGSLVKESGERVDFESTEFFKAGSTSSVGTYWGSLSA